MTPEQANTSADHVKKSPESERVQALEEALTPSAGTKAAYLGEFSFPFSTRDEFGDEVVFTPNVPWTTIKEIMAAIKARAFLSRAEG